MFLPRFSAYPQIRPMRKDQMLIWSYARQPWEAYTSGKMLIWLIREGEQVAGVRTVKTIVPSHRPRARPVEELTLTLRGVRTYSPVRSL